ncbi:hypothetical protein L6164_023864 [Bauhinia variegata]|uniref:Uncharacterized protein n=1 Tax=Bauhinia variegata TaxID=167791 RepID=A0ACB9MJH2_BAUVA|nr:hypothetical protein L6164_023864 [Bauhinia variegata]
MFLVKLLSEITEANPRSRGEQFVFSISASVLILFIPRIERSKSVTFFDLSPVMDLDDAGRVLESSSRVELVVSEEHSIQEPYEGMEFESEDAAKIFYDEYARRVGFVMRVMSCRRSERDGRILARRIGCNKEGHCVSIRGKFGTVRQPRPSTREGCKAMIHIKFDKSGKWVITKFVKDHNHPLVVSPREARQTMDEKDRKIQELTAELRNKKRAGAVAPELTLELRARVCDHLRLNCCYIISTQQWE